MNKSCAVFGFYLKLQSEYKLLDIIQKHKFKVVQIIKKVKI